MQNKIIFIKASISEARNQLKEELKALPKFRLLVDPRSRKVSVKVNDADLFKSVKDRWFNIISGLEHLGHDEWYKVQNHETGGEIKFSWSLAEVLGLAYIQDDKTWIDSEIIKEELGLVHS